MQPTMVMEYSKVFSWGGMIIMCSLNLLCYVIRKFSLLRAISNSECVCATLYKECGMTKERFVEFLEQGTMSPRYWDSMFPQIMQEATIMIMLNGELKELIKNAIKPVKKENVKKDSTLKRKPKIYNGYYINFII